MLVKEFVMTYRVPELEVSEETPFANDALGRRDVVEFLAGFIGDAGGPFVLALNSPWGSGKTTLIRMLAAELKRNKYSYVYFNAWEVDYVTDPLVALVSSVDRVELGLEGTVKASFKGHMKRVRSVTSLIAKRAAVVATKALTAGALDLEAEIGAAASELAADAVGDIVEAFHKETSLLEEFKNELAQAIQQLPDAERNLPLVMFIDEIDRCRPTFTIELLERIKHLFDLPNLMFVLSVDKEQLEASISSVYGQGINAAEYLRRFIDLEYMLPPANSRQFVMSLLGRLSLNEVFSLRTHPELQSDRDNFVRYFVAIADAVPLSLRAQERCLTQLKVVMSQTPAENYLEPVLVALLIILKSCNSDLFLRLCSGDAAAEDVIAYLNSLPKWRKRENERLEVVIEANLINMDPNYERRAESIEALKKLAGSPNSEDQEQARPVLDIINRLQTRLNNIELSYVSKKIDLAAWIQPA